MMQDWGDGLLQTGRDYHYIQAFDEALGLRELREMFLLRINVDASLRFSINAEFNYGAESIAITRKYLESGALDKLLQEDLFKDNRCWNFEDARRCDVLVACLISLGCAMPHCLKGNMNNRFHPSVIARHKKYGREWMMTSKANAQLKKAYNEYKVGEPYDFGNTSFLVATHGKMLPGKTVMTDMVAMKLVETTLPSGQVVPQYVGAPDDEELGFKKNHPMGVCASCGKGTKDGGKALDVCGKCHSRKYCSKTCQKRHWKLHKPICTRPAGQVNAFLYEVTTGYAKVCKKAFEEAEARYAAKKAAEG